MCEINEAGSVVHRRFFHTRDRLYYDESFLGTDWKTVRTEDDHWYFGIWVNPKDRKILIWCEGDEILVESPGPDEWAQEMCRLQQYYPKSNFLGVER